MKAIHRTITLAALATLATAALATPDATDQQVEITAPRIAAVAAQVVLDRRELDTKYQMSTGRTMTVSLDGQAVRMRYGRRPAAVLRHDGQGNFVSQDRQWVLQFELDRSGDPDNVRLTLPKDWM